MKRRQRKTVLNINGESESPRRRWPNERQSQNGSPSNPLQNLVGQYNSDSEAEDDNRPRSHMLNDQVNDFLKEIQSITPEDSNQNNRNPSMSRPGSYWQECFDEQTGYPYYWHTETNQVTWEMPPELKALVEKSQRETNAPPGSHIPQWSTNKFAQSQSNIPDGMIPKEVVARNRNRQAGILNKPAKPPSKTNNSKSPGLKKDDSYDEGKIEMITSFGNEESESEEESERDETPKKQQPPPQPQQQQQQQQPMPPSCLKKSSMKPPAHSKPTAMQDSSSPSSSSSSKAAASESRHSRPAPPPMHYGPQNKEKLSEKLSQTVQSSRSDSSSSSSISRNEEDILTRLKNQAKLLQFLGNKSISEHSSNNKPSSSSSSTGANPESGHKPSKDLKLSLVPGYEDDSDGEEDSHSHQHSRKLGKPLFPISESAAATAASEDSNSRDKLAKRIETSAGNIRIYDYRNVEQTAAAAAAEDKAEEEAADRPESNDNNAEEEAKAEMEAKTNKFLESIDAPTKAFQRKRRIAFDVAPSKGKPQETKDESPSSMNSGLTDGAERRGLGFAKDETDGTAPEADGSSKGEAEGKRPAAISFVKGSTPTTTPTTTTTATTTSTKEEESNGAAAGKTKEKSEAERVELRALTEPIMEKLRFLSEGSPVTSAVQVMAIQIQTLLSAWESGELQESYLRNWLAGTGCELTRLEQTAAPPGWECQWDRSHKRYYYRHVLTGEAQWTYPEADIVGGTEEMELCTTPPPPEHVEAPIIEMSAQAAMMSTRADGKSNSRNADAEQQQQQQQPPPQPPQPSGEPTAPPPPPPTISSPSPPPPPRIYAEDLKRSRKRKASPQAESDRKDESGKDGGKPLTEPLPPGVDPPEISYTLPASALEAGVLYGAQQTNPIYAATLAGAGIPLLPHHHTALMQGQLMHYNPAYHQHFHNQALVAARLQGQEAVQFMVAEYARVYDQNNQVIAKPPMKMPHETSLGSAINSFYSDIASIEKTSADVENPGLMAAVAAAATRAESVASPVPPQVPQMDDPNATLDATKEKKKKKLKTGLGKKQKEMSSMVAKWQRAQKNYKEGH